MNSASSLACESAKGGGGPLADQPHDGEIVAVATALEEALRTKDVASFYKAFRATRLPFLCRDYAAAPHRMFSTCFDIVHRLGGLSPAVALAVENHLYVTSAIATFPKGGDPSLERSCCNLIDAVVEGRLLVANTNSKVHARKIGEFGTLARREGNGVRVNGTAAYASLATEADLLILLTELENEGFAFVMTPSVRDNPAVEIGAYLFPSAMLDSDTRSITFHDLWRPSEAVIAVAQSEVAGSLIPFEMAWHQLLIPTLYLGAAARAIEEVRRFLLATNDRAGRPLAELDGMVVDVGRLVLEYRSARCVVEKAADTLIEVKTLPRDASKLDQAVQLASAAKYAGTLAAESILTSARRIIGARAFRGDCILERLSNEVMFASLGPEVNAVIERRYGKRALAGEFFPNSHAS